MIEYKFQAGKPVKVYLDGTICGEIRKVENGHQYFPSGSKTGGEVLVTVLSVQQSLGEEGSLLGTTTPEEPAKVELTKAEINSAITHAVDSLYEYVNESYEGSELDEPEVIAWQKKIYKTVEILETLKR